jgi:hypothetical protein
MTWTVHRVITVLLLLRAYFLLNIFTVPPLSDVIGGGAYTDTR